MPTDTLYHELAEVYLQTLANRDIAHRRVYIIFSGVPGSGKTTLARKLARDLRAQYVRHDDIRALVRARGHDINQIAIPSISSIVIDTILEKDANKCIIIDASLDRSWPRFFDHAKEQRAQPIVVRLNVPRAEVERRIHAREDHDFGKIEDLDAYYEQFENSKKNVIADLELDSDYDYENALAELRLKIA